MPANAAHGRRCFSADGSDRDVVGVAVAGLIVFGAMAGAGNRFALAGLVTFLPAALITAPGETTAMHAAVPSEGSSQWLT